VTVSIPDLLRKPNFWMIQFSRAHYTQFNSWFSTSSANSRSHKVRLYAQNVRQTFSFKMIKNRVVHNGVMPGAQATLSARDLWGSCCQARRQCSGI
jgi:hypothetical protein